MNSSAVASRLVDYRALVGNRTPNWVAQGGKLSCVLSVMVVRMRNEHSQLVLYLLHFGSPVLVLAGCSS